MQKQGRCFSVTLHWLALIPRSQPLQCPGWWESICSPSLSHMSCATHSHSIIHSGWLWINEAPPLFLLAPALVCRAFMFSMFFFSLLNLLWHTSVCTIHDSALIWEHLTLCMYLAFNYLMSHIVQKNHFCFSRYLSFFFFCVHPQKVCHGTHLKKWLWCNLIKGTDSGLTN